MLEESFSHVLGIINFSPKLTVLQRLQPLHIGHFCRFSKSYFSDTRCFLGRFFAKNSFMMCL